MDRCFTLEYAALPVLGTGFRVPLDDVDILDEETVLFADDFEDLADLASVLAGDDLYLVIFLDLYRVSDHFIFSTGPDR
jgi:hypothetical protein